VQQSDTEAVKWWRKTAEQGNNEAQFNLGTAYEKGIGVEQDYVQAYKWFNTLTDNSIAINKRDAIKKLVITKQIVQAQNTA